VSGYDIFDRLFLDERIRIKLKCSFTNMRNHCNPGNPQLATTGSGVGPVYDAPPADLGGGHTGPLGAPRLLEIGTLRCN
jgi:hypothetical protein